MGDYMSIISAMIGIPIWLLVVIFVWSGIWKAIALWKSARNNHLVWFIVLLLVNTIGILEILYIYVFSKKKFTKSKKPRKRKR